MTQQTNHPTTEQLLNDPEYRRLLRQHERLESELDEKQKGATVDWDHVNQVKRRKLAIADALEKMRRVRV